jgi:hypothetical protein
MEDHRERNAEEAFWSIVSASTQFGNSMVHLQLHGTKGPHYSDASMAHIDLGACYFLYSLHILLYFFHLSFTHYQLPSPYQNTMSSRTSFDCNRDLDSSYFLPSERDDESGYASSGSSSVSIVPEVYFTKPHLRFLNRQLQTLEPQGWSIFF